MNDEFNNNNDLQIHLEEYARRLSTAISKMRVQDNRVSFTLNEAIATEIRGLSMLEGVSLSEMCNILLTEYMTQG